MRVETFQTPGPLRLDLRVPVGRVDIETVDGAETRVELEALQGEEEALEHVVVELRESGDGHELVVAVEEEKRFLLIFTTVPEITVRITCPHGARLGANVVSADLRARGRYADASVKSVSGDVRLERVEGDAAAKSVSGDVHVDEAGGRVTIQSVSGDLRIDRAGGQAELRTTSGDVRLGDAAESVTGQTVSGDLVLDAVTQGAVTLKSVSGDMLVGIRPGSKLWVDAKSLSGDTTSELAVGDAPPAGEGPLVELRATAMSGDIRIVRAG